MKFDLEWAFSNYNDSFLQDMLVVLRELSKIGITIEDVLAYGKKEILERRSDAYEIRKSNEQRQRAYLENARRCKACGEVMGLAPVNDMNCTQVGGAYRSMWFCSDTMGCGETLYSDRPIHEEAEANGLGDYFPDPKKTPTSREMRRRHGKRMRTAYTQPNHPRKEGCTGCK